MTNQYEHQSYTTPQVAKIVGVNVRKIIAFIERGYVKPSIQDAAGHGSQRLWSYMDIIRCAVIHSMLEVLSVKRARWLAEQLSDDRGLKPDFRIGMGVNFSEDKPFVEASLGLDHIAIDRAEEESGDWPIGIKIRMVHYHTWVQRRIEKLL